MVLAVAAEAGAQASTLQVVGAGLFGAVLGWFVYFANRHRREEVKLTDVGALVGVIAGAAVLALFPAGTDLFGAYGIGLAAGFFGYFAVLVLLIARSGTYTVDYLISGRGPALGKDEVQHEPHAMGGGDHGAATAEPPEQLRRTGIH